MAICGLILTFALAACQNAPQRIDKIAEDSGLTKTILNGDPFKHVVYQKTGKNSGVLHIYIDGDGSPWRNGQFIADDPTPRQPLALALMAQDSSPSIYLGRPCYFGLSNQANCESKYWTSDRYSSIVVVSMASAANSYIQSRKFSRVVLIGHSGGGTLAVLLADKIQKVTQVITIAANLDTLQWTRYHHYLPLAGSLNPYNDAKLADIDHTHYVGDEDKVISKELAIDFVNKHGGLLRVIKGFTHHCCWKKRWPIILADLPI